MTNAEITNSLSLFDLTGRNALVVGASRGIGAAIASGLASAGAKVVSCGRSASPAGQFDGVRYVQCDASDQQALGALCTEAAGQRKQIDVFVFAAAVTSPATGSMQSVAQFEDTIAVNLTSAYRAARDAAQWMRESASIIFITSINSEFGFPGNPGYVAAKGGLRMLAKALAVDLGPDGIRVNAIAPGYIRTDMTAASYADPDKRAARAGRTILGRWGEVDDLIGAAVFLASDASRYVTGQDLFVDGGWTAKGL